VFDPSDPQSFWTFQQVAGRDNQWSTQISQIRFGPSVQAPEPALAIALFGVAGIAVRRRRSA
jgi:MYXO-CTERM domain-containing protein